MSVYGTLTDLVTAVDDVRNRATTSLSEYSKITSIIHRAYIHERVANDEICTPLISTLLQLNIGYVLTAVGLNQIVNGKKTVRDTLKTIATESYAMELIGTDIDVRHFNKPCFALEASAVETEGNNSRFAAGRIVEVEIVCGASADGSKIGSIKANIHVQILGHQINDTVATTYMTMNFSPSFGQRFMQARAGEIRLIQDMILAKDLTEKHAKALRSDNTGIISEMEAHKQAMFFRTIMSWIGLHPENHNTANTILINEKNNFRQSCHDANLQFDRYADREKFFKKSMALSVVVVDLEYNQVKIYMNGIDAAGEATFAQINTVGRGADKMQLKDVMAALGQGGIPRMM